MHVNTQKSMSCKAICIIMMSLLSVYVLTSCSYFKTRSYQVTETYKILSADGSKSFLSVDLPISYGCQEIGKVTVKNTDEYYFEEKDGYQVLHAVISGDGSEKTVGIDYTVTLYSQERSWSMDVRDEYLEPCENVDSDNKNIVEAVRHLIVKNDDYRTAKKISAFVTKTIKFDRSTRINEKTLPASEVLMQRQGVCNDYANLAAAMLRAAGIPARPVSGLVYSSLNEAADWSHPGGSHAWVEFYADGGWHFADPTWGTVILTSRTDITFHMGQSRQISVLKGIRRSSGSL